MQMDIRLRERVERDAQRGGTGSQETPRRLRRFLHYVAELAGQRDLTLARHADRLDEHDVAAHRRPREPGRHADLRRAAGDLALHLRLAGVLFEVFRRHLHHRRLPLDDFQRGFAQHALDFALELPHARFARILGDQPVERAVGDMGALFLLALSQTRLFHLPRHEVTLGDLQLLRRRVADERQLLHAVEQRIGDG